MNDSEYKEILKPFFIRWCKEHGYWDKWKEQFKKHKTFEDVFNACSRYRYIKVDVSFAQIYIQGTQYGLPYGVLTNYKGFSINRIHDDYGEDSYAVGKKFKQDFITYLEVKHGKAGI